MGNGTRSAWDRFATTSFLLHCGPSWMTPIEAPVDIWGSECLWVPQTTCFWGTNRPGIWEKRGRSQHRGSRGFVICSYNSAPIRSGVKVFNDRTPGYKPTNCLHSTRIRVLRSRQPIKLAAGVNADAHGHNDDRRFKTVYELNKRNRTFENSFVSSRSFQWFPSHC